MAKRAPKLIERPGLRNVAYGVTALCRLDQKNKRLEYCGYSVEDLAAHSSFEEVAWLLLHGEFPTEEESEKFCRELRFSQLRAIRSFGAHSGYVKNVLQQHLLHAHPMDILRSMVSVLGANMLGMAHVEMLHDHGVQTLGYLPVFVAAIGRHLAGTLEDSESFYAPTITRSDLPFPAARTFLELLRRDSPSEEEVRALDTSLILYAEHEFNLGTHVVHAIASSNSDLYSALCGAIGGLRGDLHGGANEAVLDLLKQIRTPDRVVSVLTEHMEQGPVMGFGHAVYKDGDPRCAIIKPFVEELAKTPEQKMFFEVACAVEEAMLTIKPGRKLYPNIDFWIAPLYEFLHIPQPLFTPIFAMARTAGWIAHFLEYRKRARDTKGRLILLRPRGRYVGPPSRAFVPMEERGN